MLGAGEGGSGIHFLVAGPLLAGVVGGLKDLRRTSGTNYRRRTMSPRLC